VKERHLKVLKGKPPKDLYALLEFSLVWRLVKGGTISLRSSQVWLRRCNAVASQTQLQAKETLILLKTERRNSGSGLIWGMGDRGTGLERW